MFQTVPFAPVTTTPLRRYFNCYNKYSINSFNSSFVLLCTFCVLTRFWSLIQRHMSQGKHGNKQLEAATSCCYDVILSDNRSFTNLLLLTAVKLLFLSKDCGGCGVRDIMVVCWQELTLVLTYYPNCTFCTPLPAEECDTFDGDGSP